MDGLDRARGGYALLQAIAHALDQVFQHAHLAGQLVRAAGDIALDPLEHLAELVAHGLDLVGEDLLGLAQGLQLAAHATGLHAAHDQSLDGKGQGHDANQAGYARTPAATAAPQEQGCRQSQTEVGADQERPGDLAHRPAVSESGDYPPDTTVKSNGMKLGAQAASPQPRDQRVGTGFSPR